MSTITKEQLYLLRISDPEVPKFPNDIPESQVIKGRNPDIVIYVLGIAEDNKFSSYGVFKSEKGTSKITKLSSTDSGTSINKICVDLNNYAKKIPLKTGFLENNISVIPSPEMAGEYDLDGRVLELKALNFEAKKDVELALKDNSFLYLK